MGLAEGPGLDEEGGALSLGRSCEPQHQAAEGKAGLWAWESRTQPGWISSEEKDGEGGGPGGVAGYEVGLH